MASHRTTRVAGVLVLLLPVLPCGCAGGDPADGGSATSPADAVSGGGAVGLQDPRLVVLLHLDTDSEDMILDGRRAFEAAGLAHEFVDLADLESADRPAFVAGKESGYLLYVLPEEKEAALATYEAWMATLTARAREIPPPPRALELGPAVELDRERVAVVTAELERRVRADQEVRRAGRVAGDMQAVDAGNTAYLRSLVQEVGWIDVPRFGRAAAEAAFLLVQHSGDIPLMLAALPGIERDVRAGHLDGQPFALLHDRLHFMQGGQQRYGTQIVIRDSGEQVVERLEDPDHVDDRRRELGLEPLAKYLSRFDGEVRIER